MCTGSRVSWLVAVVGGVVALGGAVPALAGQTASPAPMVSEARSDDGLALTVFTVPYLGLETPASVLVGVEVRGLVETVSGAPSGPRQLDVSYAAVSGFSQIAEQTVTMGLSEQTARRAAREGARVFGRLSLAPGTYTLRLMVRDSGDRRAVSTTHTLTVPNLRESAITMSGLVVTASDVGGATQGDVDEGDRTLLILGRPPTGRRQFSRREQLEVNAEIYTVPPTVPDDDIDQQLRVTTSLVASDGGVVFELADLGGSETLPNGVYGYWHYALVQVASVAPGPYTLTVSVSDGVSSAAQSMPITIVD